MYKAERRIRYGNAFSKAVYTKVGVLAGCPVAMGLLLLAVIDPVDRFWKNIPRELASLKVYVDDFVLSFIFKNMSLPMTSLRVELCVRTSACDMSLKTRV